MTEPALAALDFRSIPLGTRAADAMLKQAAISTLRAGSFQPGRYLVILTGGVGEVEESFRAGLRVGGAALVDSILLPDVDSSVRAAVFGKRVAPAGETLGVFETASLPATIHAADAAVKGAAVTLREIRLGDGLGGKGLVHLDGALADVQAAAAIARDIAAGHGGEFGCEVISAVHAGLIREIAAATRFMRD